MTPGKSASKRPRPPAPYRNPARVFRSRRRLQSGLPDAGTTENFAAIWSRRNAGRQPKTSGQDGGERKESSCVLASPGQRPGLAHCPAEGAERGRRPRSQSLAPPEAPRPRARAQGATLSRAGGARGQAGAWGATRPAGPGERPPADSRPLRPLPRPFTPTLPAPRSGPLVAATGRGTPGARRPPPSSLARELKPNICAYNALSRPTAAGTRGRKKGVGGRSCHMQMTVCGGLFSFSFSGNPGALLPVPLSHRLPIVPALGTAGGGGPSSPDAPSAHTRRRPRGPGELRPPPPARSAPRASSHRFPLPSPGRCPQTCPAPRVPARRAPLAETEVPNRPARPPRARAPGTSACEALASV